MRKRVNNVVEDNVLSEEQEKEISSPLEKSERLMQVMGSWANIDDCAASVFGSIHNSLLQGELVFGYRRTDTKSDLIQIVIVKNLPQHDGYTGEVISNSGWGYSYGIVTTGWTALYPCVPMECLENDIIQDMLRYKVDVEVIKMYKSILGVTKLKYGTEESNFSN